MSKYEGHTPGPWDFRETHTMSQSKWYVIVDPNGRGPIVDVGGKDMDGQIAEAKYLVTDHDEIRANARLIADAPILAERVEELEEENFKLTEAIKTQSTVIASARIGMLTEQNAKMLALIHKIEGILSRNLRPENKIAKINEAIDNEEQLISEVEGA